MANAFIDDNNTIDDAVPATMLDANGEFDEPDAPGKRYQSSVSKMSLLCFSISLTKLFHTQDDPMGAWLPLQQSFLDESVRRDGLATRTRCISCKAAFADPSLPTPAEPPSNDSHSSEDLPQQSSPGLPTPSCSTTPTSEPAGASRTPSSVGALIRCESCGQFSECIPCCLRRHELTPLHVVKVSFISLRSPSMSLSLYSM
jgi:hypothetical protein